MSIESDLKSAAVLLATLSAEGEIKIEVESVAALAARLQAHAERVAALETVVATAKAGDCPCWNCAALREL